MTSQCSTSTPSLMRRMSAAIQFTGAPKPENRPWIITRSPSATIHSRLILQRRGDALYQIEQAFASGRDVSAVLDVVGRPEALSCYVVTLIEQCVECLEDKRLVFRFRARTTDCGRLSKARVKAAVKIKSGIMKLGTKWIRQ